MRSSRMHEPASDPIHKATIIPRGRALGMVMRLPERDSYSYHRDKMYANLAVSMGGRVAEEVIFGYDKVSSGASYDIQQATEPGPRHGHANGACRTRLGPLQYRDSRGGGVPRLFVSTASATCRTRPRRLIDKEIRRIVEEGLCSREARPDRACRRAPRARQRPCSNIETLTGEEIKKAIARRGYRPRAIRRRQAAGFRPAAPRSPRPAAPRAASADPRRREPDALGSCLAAISEPSDDAIRLEIAQSRLGK